MRFDLHLRNNIQKQVEELAEKMKSWEDQPRFDYSERLEIQDRLTLFRHTIQRDGLRIGGTDGSGDFPSVAYADSFVYVAVANGAVYESDRVSGLREVSPSQEPLVHFAWIPENENERNNALNQAFEYLSGMSVQEVIQKSDYRQLRTGQVRRRENVDDIVDSLIRPHAFDAGNIGIQLRSVAELGAARKMLNEYSDLDYLLLDGTFSLPLVNKSGPSLFHEHLKRLCCVEALEKNIGFFALSKSHGLPNVEMLEQIVDEKAGRKAEHWYLRLPVQGVDGWKFSMAEDRQIPPLGAVSYLVRFHQSTPIMRLDMDFAFWQRNIIGQDEAMTRQREQKIFEDLDYASHDQRCFGYPYPIKAGHDRASMTQAERIALRKQIVDAAIKAGMKRALFRDPSISTGHE